MADPLITLIGRAIATRLSTIPVVTKVTRPKGRVDSISPDDGEVILFQQNPNRRAGEEDIAGTVWDVPFEATFHIHLGREDDAGNTADPQDDRLNLYWSEVVKAIEEDRKWGLTTYVWDTELDDPVYDTVLDGAVGVCVVRFTVTYEHKVGDPTSAV